MEGGPCVVIHRFVRKFHIRGVRLQLQRPGMGKNFKRSVLRINLRSIVEKSIYIYRYKSKQKYCSKIFWTRLKTLEAIFTGKFWAKNLISPGSLTALRCELQGRGLRLSPSRVKSRSGNFFRVNVGRPAVATSAKEQPFRSDLSLSRVVVIHRWSFRVSSSLYILFHDVHEGSRGFEILKFRANRKWEVEGKIGLGSAMLSIVWLIWKRNFSKHSRTPFEEVSFFLVSERILKLRILLSVKNEIFFRSDVHLNRMKLKNVWLKNARI